jgi:hypothetical protein
MKFLAYHTTFLVEKITKKKRYKYYSTVVKEKKNITFTNK